MAKFSPFVQQSQQCGRSEFSRVFSSPVAKHTNVSRRFKKWNRALNCSSLNFFYLSIVEVIQNERKTNFVTRYDRISRVNERVMSSNVGSINDSRINVKKCASRNGLKLRSAHSRSQRPRSFWSAPRIATSGPVQRHSVFEWLWKHNRLRPEPIRFVRLDSEHAQSDGKSVNRGLPVLDQARGFTAVKRLGICVNTRVI